MQNFFNMKNFVVKQKIAIDLGTANTLVWVAGIGIVANEPTVVATSVDDNRIVAVGIEAKKMLGRTPEALMANRPMREGVIADYQATEAMLKYFIGRAVASGNGINKVLNKVIRPDVMVCVPAGCTQVERRAALDATLS